MNSPFARFGLGGAVVACLALLGCTSDPSDSSGSGTVAIVVSAPLSTQRWVGEFMQNGARLAVHDVNARGGVKTPDGMRKLRLVVLDNAGSPSKAAADARTAVADKAAILLSDGTGAAGVADVTGPASLPVFICFEGGDGLVDPSKWPTLFRMAPANAPMASRLADYIANQRPHVALLTDDTTYGTQGRRAVKAALGRDRVDVVTEQEVSADAANVSAQVLAAKNAGADRLVVWAGSQAVAATVQAIHELGWDVPVLSGPTGEDPSIRQRLAAHPTWLSSLTFASFRITSEVGPAPFESFRRHYEKQLKPQTIGLKQDGKAIVQPPDWAMFPYDAVQLTAIAFKQGGDVGPKLLTTLNAVKAVGANGDARGYSKTQHEGVNPSDMYFARYDGFTFHAVRDDPLSESLPEVDQLQD